ncbi:MAG: Omp85 family outer membrane protein [Spirochaetota bacterium]
MKKSILIKLLCVLVIIAVPLQGFALTRMGDEDLEKKKEGWYPTGLPLINYDSDNGLGYGARIYLYNNGARDDEYFAYSPYKLQMYAQFYQTTNGYQYHEFNLDMPYIAGTKFRIKTSVAFDKKINANYFGLGAENAKQGFVLIDIPNSVDEEFDKYSDFAEYVDEEKGYKKYYNYQYSKPSYFLNIYRNLTDELRFMVGFEVKKVTIDTWDGEDFDGDDQIVTKIEQEQPNGIDGGWSNFARIGFGYDTRDFEPDPNNGYYIDYSYEVGTEYLGSDYDFYRNTFGARYYLQIFKPLVLAMRVGYTDINGSDVPFFEMNTFGFLLNRRNGLGNNRTLRGHKADRFVGKTMTLGNAELRFKFAEANAGGQNFKFKLTGFYDAGNVYDKWSDPFDDPRWVDYHHGYGGGLVIAWNLSTIVHFYYGMSKEDSSISVDFMHTY